MRDPRPLGRARQSDPSLFEFGIPRRRMRAPRARHERPPALRDLCRRSNGNPMTAGIATGGAIRRRSVLAETYLDWNATAPLRPEAAAAMAAVLANCGNPS